MLYNNLFIFPKNINIYGVGDDMHRNSDGESLEVSLSLKPGHFLMSSPIDMLNYLTLFIILLLSPTWSPSHKK